MLECGVDLVFDTDVTAHRARAVLAERGDDLRRGLFVDISDHDASTIAGEALAHGAPDT